MAIDPSIITAGMRQPEQVDPMGVLGKVLTLRNAQQQQQIGALDLQEKQKAFTDQQQVADAYKQAFTTNESGVLTLDRNKLTQGLAASGQGDKLPKISASLDAADKATAEAKAARADAETKTLDAAGHLAAGVRILGYTPESFSTAVHHMAANGLIPPEDAQQYLAAAQQDPSAIQKITDHILAQSPKESELATAARTADSRVQAAQTGATRFQAELPKITAETLRAQNQNAGTEPMTPYQKAELARQAAANAETARHNKVSEGALTDDALNMAADQFAATGVMSSAGRSAAQRALILNRAAQRQPNVDIASNAAAYKANQSSLQNVTKTLDTLTAFESTAGKNLDQFTTAFKKLEDTGSPLLNVPLRALANRVGGNPDVAAANAAGTVALREIARVTNDPKLSGVLSDSARQEVASLVPEGATLKQLAAVTKVLKADMANVHSSLSDQKDAISSRISGKKADTPPPAKFSVGDVVTVGGKQIKITALHPDGTFDGDPVKK